MSLQTRLSALITAIGTDVKALQARTPTILSAPSQSALSEASEPTKAVEWWYTSTGALIGKLITIVPIVNSVVLDKGEMWIRVKSRTGGSTQVKLLLDSDGLSDFSTYTQGTAAARPGASAPLKGVYYYATDTGAFSFCTGTAWVQLIGPPTGVLQPLNAAFSNTYVNYTATSPFRYWKDSSGFVHIIGEINTSGVGINTAGTVIINLPAGYRPLGRVLFKGSTNTSPYVNHYEIGANGDLKVDSNGNNPASYANFGHMTYPTNV